MDVNKNRNEWMWLDKVNTWLKRHGFLAWLLDFSVLMLFAMITGILVFQIPFLPTYLKGNYVFPLFINILVLLYYAYGSILLENIQKIADFFDMDVQELDPRYLSVHNPTSFSLEFTDIFQSLDQSRKQAVTDFAKKELENQTTEERLKDDYFPYKVYESYQTFLNKPEQADIVWLDKELDYDIALWIRTDSLEPKYPQGSVALIKNTHFEFAGAIYAIDYDGQTILKRVFNDPTGIRLISLNKKYSDKFIPHQEEPKVIGRVMAAFMPLDLSEQAKKPL